MGKISDKTVIQLVGCIFEELDVSDELETVSKALGYMYKW